MQDRRVLVGVIAIGAAAVGAYFLLKPEQAQAQALKSETDLPVDNNFIENFVEDSMAAIGLGVKRGIRNNNPGNLVITSIPWRGKVPASKNTDGKFEQFTNPVDGIRAMFMDLRGDIEKDGLNTIRKLITEYAPKFENNTAAYIASVSAQLGLGADSKIQPLHYFDLVKAIIKHENGLNPYSDSTIKAGIAAA